MPSAAREELETDPDGTALRILELRAYHQTKLAIEASSKPGSPIPTGPLAELVLSVQADILRAARAGD